MLDDIAEGTIDWLGPSRLWKVAVGTGVAVLLIGLAVLGVGSGIEVPATVEVYGQSFSCEQVKAETSGTLGLAATALSDELREAKSQCDRDLVRLGLMGLGSVVSIAAGLWTIGWWIYGQRRSTQHTSSTGSGA